MMTPKNIHKIFMAKIVFVFLKTPKYIEIQNFEPQKMNRAYVCMKISKYPPPWEPYVSRWASSRENLSLGFPTKSDSNQSAQLQRIARKFKNSTEVNLCMILSKKRITTALIRLHGCPG